MDQQRRQRPPCLRLVAGLVLAAWGLAALPAAAGVFTPEPSSAHEIISIGGKGYVALGADPVMVKLVGPGRFYGYMRVGFAPGETEAKSGVIQIAGVGSRTMRLPLNFEPSGVTTWDDGRPGTPSGGRKFEFYLPRGIWNAQLTGSVDGGGVTAAILYYDGPAQDTRPGEAAKKSPWRFRNSFTADFIYDDNVFTLHPEAIDDFLYYDVIGGLPKMESHDDFVFAPTLDLAAERKFFSPGKTRFRFKVKRWIYTQNPIKTNTDFDFYVRQWFPGGKSLELYLHHAPEQYIRELGDRAPFETTSADKEFRFTRNVANLTWRHYVTRTFSYKLTVETNRRYYNKPFMENDIEAWEVRGSVAYKMFDRNLTVSVDYSFEDANGRGHDTVGETADNSDDSDPSYNRDLYRLGLDLDVDWLTSLVDDVGVAYLFMDYYYTTDKDLFESPYQVGRRDKWAKAFIKAGKRLRRGLDLDFTFTYSERQVESPWYGDITLDKDYISHRYSLALSYDF